MDDFRQALIQQRQQLRPTAVVEQTSRVVVVDDEEEKVSYTCDICKSAIETSFTRWNCVECTQEWNCCVPCYSSGAAQSHGHMLEPEMVTETPQLVAETCNELILESSREFSTRPLLGMRLEQSAGFTWLRYCDVVEFALDFSAALKDAVLQNDSTCALCSENITLQFVVALLGTMLRGFVVALLPPKVDSEAMQSMLNIAQARVLIPDTAHKKTILQAAQKCHLAIDCIVELRASDRNILMSKTPWSPTNSSHPTRLASTCLSNLIAYGRVLRMSSEDCASPFKCPNLVHLGIIGAFDSDSFRALLFTSGSTGRPKGMRFPDRSLSSPGARAIPFQPFVLVDYQPFDAGYITQILATMRNGGRRGIASMANLINDFKAVRPTTIGATPIFWNLLHDQYQYERAEALHEVQLVGCRDQLIEDRLQKLDAKWRICLGNRVRAASSGGASVAQHVLDWARRVLDLTVSDNYGAREVGAIAQAGVVLPWVQVKISTLRFVEESCTEQFPLEQPAEVQTGEICVQTPNMIDSYLGDEDNAGKFLMIEGEIFYRTGDIGELAVGPDGKRHLKLLDRCATRFKLASGEWVLPGQIELCLEASPWVQSALVMGSTTSNFPVAVVVPTATFRNVSTKCRDESEIVARLLQLLRAWCVQSNIRNSQVPQAVHLEKEPWTVENLSLLPGLKKNRPFLLKRYDEVRNGLCTDSISTSSCLALHRGEVTFNCMELERILSGFLQLADLSNLKNSLLDLGINSLASAQICSRLSAIGVQMDVGTLLATPLHYLDSLVLSALHAPLVASVTHSDSLVDWDAECDVSNMLEGCRYGRSVGATRCKDVVLLTGVTGFLGPYLLSEILNQYAVTTKVVCIVRALDSIAGMARIREALQVIRRWDETLIDRLVIMIGDLAKPLWGLSNSDLASLRELCPTDFYLNGSHVNVILPYSALRAPNVQSVKEALVLAQMCEMPRFHYVSSSAAVAPSEQSQAILSDVETVMERSFESIQELRSGYAQSKAAAEGILSRSAEICDIDARVFRPSTISGSKSTGHSNVLDYSLLLLSAAVQLGTAPLSSSMPLCWVPVDFVAASIVKIARLPSAETKGRAFNLLGSAPSFGTLLEVSTSVLQRSVTNLTGEEWRIAVASTSKLPYHHRAAPVRESLRRLDFFEEGSMSCTRYVDLPTGNARNSLRGEWFDIDDDYMRVCVSWLAKAGFFD